MKSLRAILVCILSSVLCTPLWAEYWSTHFAYNNVTQIAMSPNKVYAISDGSLYSVNKQTEQIQVYNRQSGLHGTGITCIYYDSSSKQLIIGYGTGKIDLLNTRSVKYLGELYDKDMTQRKTINNITIYKHTAYISTAFGIQTLDMRTDRLVDSYWLRPAGLETDVQDVVIKNDSIYAFTTDSMFCASLKANIVDYTFWRREIRTGRVSPDPDKGRHYKENNENWYAGNAEGIIRVAPTGRYTYKPQGPLSNIPYRIRTCGNKMGMVQGGYDATFYMRPALVMTYENNRWTNYDTDYLQKHLGGLSRDYCDIAFDPSDPSHFFVATFGYGLLEFKNNEFAHLYNPSNSPIEPVIVGASTPYIWVDGLRFDNEGNLWMLNNSANGVKVLKRNGTWTVFSNAACFNLSRSQDLLISNQNPHIKFISSLNSKSIGVMDDNGTLDDPSDDRAVLCQSFVDEKGNDLFLTDILIIHQLQDGTLLMGTAEGLYRIDHPETMLDGDHECKAVHLSLPSEGLTDIFTDVMIRSITLDQQGRVWIGTNLTGLFCLTPDLKSVLHHFSMDNSPMPGNNVLALEMQQATNNLFIGTGDGLIVYNENGTSGLQGDESNQSANDNSYEMGHMQQWRLHFSYTDPQEIAATPNAVYAVADGSLFSVDRADESIHYWNKSTGLNGTSVSHIAYAASTEQLVIAYADGRMDLLDNDGEVTQIPDLSMKAGSVATSINCITVGTKATYVGTEFGILALNTRKGEFSDTYFIGEEAAAIDVQHIVQLGDTLYAFSYDRLYKASIHDNLVDYEFWQQEEIPCEQVQQAAVWHDRIYTLQHDSLYRREGTQWTLVLPYVIQWVHANNGQMMLYIPGQGTFTLTDDEQLRGISGNYAPNDGIFTQGEYWLAQSKTGLIRLGTDGDSYFTATGPNSNFGYFMTAAHGQVYTTIGGRWATQFVRFGKINIYDGTSWRSIDAGDIGASVGKTAVDIVSLAVDPNDAGHFFAATYGRGVFEFKDYRAVRHYSTDTINYSTYLREAIAGIDPELYTFTDGATIDDQGNFWVLNTTNVGKPIHVLTPNGYWRPLAPRVGGEYLRFSTPLGIWPDQRNSRYKWMIDQRSTQGVILFDDGGTPTDSYDDYCVKRSTFVDQNGNTLTPTYFFCFAQDRSNRIWIGTESGIITIPASVDFFSSGECHRIIIPRNDGTNLGDYLLGDEQINCMALDGGNRMWIGTANSGLYLIEDDTITVAHFTEDNSLLPSNAIQSIAIEPITGEVFVGTDRGIASYRSDASEPRQDMKSAYAYPNPVRPNYAGVISITGLMDNTVVNIVDEGGNLVCKTRSHGGTAVWDGYAADGRKATPGVYSAFCNAEGGHTVVKILLMR